MNAVAGMPVSVIAGLALTPVMISIGQVLFKLTAQRADQANLLGVLLDPFLIVALAIYGTGTLIWLYVLRAVPLTIAYPFMALTFCLVPLIAYVILNEPVSLRYFTGIALISLGLLVINT